MTAASDADRAKAAELWRAARYADPADAPEVEDVIAAAIAEAHAPCDRLTADLRALAEELSGPAKFALSYGAIAARLRAIVAAAEKVTL